ncbi:hypothetical protein RUM44_009544 [Polyplax serrata]|uniref:Secreted protein n=1 Tax=Polyplax serrata TaxID=468196 RepID=A0ABR1AT02_POLSC
MRFSVFIAVLLLGLVCAVHCETETQSLNARDDDGKKEDGGSGSTTSATTEKGEEATFNGTTEEVTTPNPSSACGGLKGFLHLCDTHKDDDLLKKARNVPESDGEDAKHSGEHSGEDEEEKNESADSVKVEPLPKESEKRRRRRREAEDESSESNESTEEVNVAPENVPPENLALLNEGDDGSQEEGQYERKK